MSHGSFAYYWQGLFTHNETKVTLGPISGNALTRVFQDEIGVVIFQYKKNGDDDSEFPQTIQLLPRTYRQVVVLEECGSLRVIADETEIKEATGPRLLEVVTRELEPHGLEAEIREGEEW
jgi:hypothetical protein